MKVNFNKNVNQIRPTFGQLKEIRFDRSYMNSVLQKDFQARKKLLEICDLPIVKKNI